MATTQEQFAALVARFEKAALARPRIYKARVAAFALLGYGYLVLVVVVLLAALAAAVASVVYLKFLAFKLVIVIGPLVWLVLRSLVVHIAPPAGIAVTRRDAPMLFERIEGLRRAVGAPRFHRVVINDEFNAGVSHVPRLGLFGWHRNHLVLGLPFLRALHPYQLDAVIAHELGHLAGGHARFSNWLYRLRMIWSQLQDALHQGGHRGGGAIRSFFDWYVPRFNAYSFPLARANEYEADAVSARATSRQAAAEALTSVNVVGQYLQERFWPGVHAQAAETPHPAFGPLVRLDGELHEFAETSDESAAIHRAMSQQTSADNTHPALTDRLKAIGADAKLALPGTDEAAWHLLGASRERVCTELDERWKRHVVHDWRKRYDEVQESRKRLVALDDAARAAPLDAGQSVERARLERTFGSGGIDEAIAQLRGLPEAATGEALVNYQLGAWLLEKDDADGEAFVRRAIDLDTEAAAPGYVLLRDFRWRNGDHEVAHALHQQALAASEEAEAARSERAALRVTDRLQPAGLEPQRLATLSRELAGIVGVKRAWIARKRLEVRPQTPLYVLGFSIKQPWRWRDKVREQGVRNAIIRHVALPGETFVLCVDADVGRRIGAALDEINGASILL